MSEAQDSVLWLEEKAERQLQAGKAMLRDGGNFTQPECIAIGEKLLAIAAELQRSRAEIAGVTRCWKDADESWQREQTRRLSVESQLSETRVERDAARAEVERLTSTGDVKQWIRDEMELRAEIERLDKSLGVAVACLSDASVERDAAVALVREALEGTAEPAEWNPRAPSLGQEAGELSVSDETRELQEALAESFARDEASWQSWLSGNDDAEYDQLVKEAFLAGRDSLRSETNEIKTERDDQHKLIVRQANLLTAAVNALRGTPPDDTLWSHHDVAELAGSLTAELAAARLQLSAFKADAMRYRWLKANHLQTGEDSWIRTGDDLEEAVDALMEVQPAESLTKEA